MDEADQSSLTSSGGSMTVQKSLVIQSEETCSEMGVEPLKEVNSELSNATCTATCIATSRDEGWLLESALRNGEWKELLAGEFSKPYMKTLFDQLIAMDKKGACIFPPREHLFAAFNETPFSKVRVVLLGQDPYHNDGQAHGLCFSVQRGIKPPPSLKNIYKELKAEYPHFTEPDHGHLISWARQGVFMLNATLTVEAHKANSHSKLGWQRFTDTVIKTISQRSQAGVVFLLWGGFAHKKEELVDVRKHVVIKTAHPSPLSYRKFQGCRCFGKVNEALTKLGHPPVDWTAL